MEGEASGAGAEVGDAGAWDIDEVFLGEQGELLGFRTWHEDMPGDLEGELEEGRGADQVLERDALGASLDEVVESGDFPCRWFLGHSDTASEEGDVGDVFEEALGFEGGFVDSGRRQSLGGFGEDGGGVGLDRRHQRLGLAVPCGVAAFVPGTMRCSRVSSTAAVRTMKETSRKGIRNRVLAVKATPPIR